MELFRLRRKTWGTAFFAEKQRMRRESSFHRSLSRFCRNRQKTAVKQSKNRDEVSGGGDKGLPMIYSVGRFLRPEIERETLAFDLSTSQNDIS